jgi:hypothetical protein
MEEAERKKRKQKTNKKEEGLEGMDLKKAWGRKKVEGRRKQERAGRKMPQAGR